MYTKNNQPGKKLSREQLKNVKGGTQIIQAGPGCLPYGAPCSCVDICCKDLPCLGPFGGFGPGGHCGVYIDGGGASDV
jgi:hypothetical protein